MDSQKTVLVVSAHAADFVWRAGGAIALYAQKGYRVRILCLSFGERGESERLWKKEGMTVECVKQERQKESERAAGILHAYQASALFVSAAGDVCVTPEWQDVVRAAA